MDFTGATNADLRRSENGRGAGGASISVVAVVLVIRLIFLYLPTLMQIRSDAPTLRVWASFALPDDDVSHDASDQFRITHHHAGSL
jgi:hypothetical protein